MVNSYYQFGISPHKNVWEGYFEKKNGHKLRLVFSTTPGEIALFTDNYRAPKKSNVLQFFEPLSGGEVEKAELAQNDRLITIFFKESRSLLFQLFGNKANLFMIEQEQIKESFKNKSDVEGSAAPKPRKPKKKGSPPETQNVKQIMLHFDQKFPRHLIDPVIRHYQLEQAGAEKIEETVAILTDAMKNRPSFRILKDGSPCLIPYELLPLENLKTFTDINETIKFAYYNASHLRRFENRLQNIRPKLEKTLARANKAIHQLEDTDKALQRAGNYEKYGHLLMAHAHEEHDPALESLEVVDFYNNNQLLKIELKKNLSIADNAKYYYDRSAKAKRQIEESERRKKEIQMEIRKLEQLLESLNSVDTLRSLGDWEKEHEEQLMKLNILSSGRQSVSFPYRTTKVDGYEIRIGKNAKSNDTLTKQAHKEDIWLHARGTGGSHVVIQMNNDQGKPPKHVILRAAAYAAWYSGLRGSKIVPVIHTKKKYVSKPKGAPPGTVRVQREEVVMVTPEKPDSSKSTTT